MRLEEDRVRRLQVIAERSDPRLPWEVLHTGRRFVALDVPIIITPAQLAGQRIQLLDPQVVALIEAAPGIAGIQLDKLMGSSFLRIRAGNAQFSRVQVSDVESIGQKLLSMGTPDVIHLACHSRVDPGYGVSFMFGDRLVGANELADWMDAPKLMILSACQTAGDLRAPSYEENSAYALSSSWGIQTIGATGWLEMATANLFDERFYEHLSDLQCAETALTATKADLFREGRPDWFGFTLFGPMITNQ